MDIITCLTDNWDSLRFLDTQDQQFNVMLINKKKLLVNILSNH